MHQIHPSAASEFIRIATEEHGKKKWLADTVGVRLDLVGRWSRGERKPKTSMRTRLVLELGLDWTLWDAPTTQCPSSQVVHALIAAAQARKAEAAARAGKTFPDPSAPANGSDHAA